MSRELSIGKAALLVINPQNAFFGAESSFARRRKSEGEDPEAALDSCRALASAMRGAGRPVIFLRTSLRKDYLDAALPQSLLEEGIESDPDFLVEGAAGTEFVSGVSPEDGDFIVTQRGLSAFQHTHLDRLLTNLGVNQAIIVGGGTREALNDTTRIGAVLGYELFAPADALYPRGLDQDLKSSAEYTTTDTVLEAIATAVPQPATPDRTALVIVDMQNVFLDRDRALQPYATESERKAGLANNLQIVDNNIRLLDSAHRAGWPVVFLKFINRDDEEDSGLPKTGNLATWVQSRPRDWVDWGVKLVDGLNPDENDIVLEKKGNGGFSFTPLHRVLRNYGVKRCIVAGGATGGCVAATVEEGVGLGYECITVSDATYPFASPYLERLAVYGEVKSTAGVLDEISNAVG